MYSLALRKKVMRTKEKEGLNYGETAKRFVIAKSTLVRWQRRIEPKMTRRKPATRMNMDDLKKNVEEHPDAYHYERARILKASARGIGPCTQAMKNQL